MIQDQDINSLIEPEKVSFLPLQPGWYIIFGLILVVLLWFVWKRYQSWLKRAYKRQAVERIMSLSNDPSVFFQLNNIVKSVAIESYGRDKVASLSGDDWVSFLSSTSHDQKFTSTVLDALKDFQYQKQPKEFEDELIQASKNESINWIKKHK